MTRESLVIGACMYALGVWSALMLDWTITLILWGLGTAVLALGIWGGE